MDASLTSHGSDQRLTETDRLIDRLRSTPGGTAPDSDLAEHWATAWFEKIAMLEAAQRYREMADTASAFQAQWQEFAPGQPQSAPASWPWLARAGCERARALAALGDYTAALEQAQRVQSDFASAEALATRHGVARAGRLEVQFRTEQGATFARVDMVRHCDELIQRYRDDDWPDTRTVVARLRREQARLLDELDYHEEALKRYDGIWQDLTAALPAHPELAEDAADARLDQARMLRRLGRAEAADACLEDVVRQFDASRDPGTRASVALARLQMLGRWQPGGRFHDAEDADAQRLQACETLIAAHSSPQNDTEAVFVNAAWRARSELTRAQEDDASQAQAAAWAREQWRRWAAHPDERVQAEVLEAMVDHLQDADEPEEALLADADQVLARFDATTAGHLQRWLARAHLRRAMLLRSVGRTEEALAALAAIEARWQTAPQADARQQTAFARLNRVGVLRRDGRVEEALALATAPWPAEVPADADPDPRGLRYAQARVGVAAVELWRDRLPAVPESAEDETRPMPEAERAPAEESMLACLDTLLIRHGSDPDGTVRREAMDAGYGIAVQQREHRRPRAACATYARLAALFDGDDDPQVQRRLISVQLNHAYALMMLLDQPEDALPIYDKLVERHAQATDPALRDVLAKTSASRHTCLNRLQRRGVAVSYGAQYEDLTLEQRDAIAATIQQGIDASQAGRHREAIGFYDQVLGQHVESSHPELRRQCLDALVRKGYSLGRLSQYEAALAVNDEAIARYGADLSTDMERDVALAMTNRITNLTNLGRADDELAACEAVIVRWQDSNVAYLRSRVARARFTRACTLADRDAASAEQPYRELINQHLHESDVPTRLQALMGAVNLNILLRKLDRPSDAVAVSENVLPRCDAASTNDDMQEQRGKLLLGLARSHLALGDRTKAIACYDQLLRSKSEWLDTKRRTTFSKERSKVAFEQRFGRLGRWFMQRFGG